MLDEYMPIITGKYSVKLKIDEIVSIEQQLRKVVITTNEKCYSYYGKISNIDKYLDLRFYHCLSRLIINFDKVKEMRAQVIYFENGGFYYIGKNNYIKTRQTYSAYLKKML